jgi:hypothetical protein
LAGFGFLVYAAWSWHVWAGCVAAGVAFLLIGYSFDDEAAAISVARIVHPFSVKWSALKAGRTVKRNLKGV